jgi:hypothetical protein
VRAALEDEPAIATAAIAGLTGEAVVLFVLSSFVHGRLIGSTTVDSRRGRRSGVVVRAQRLPGFSAAASAIAIAQAHTAMRSVRGRLVIFLSGPLLAAMVFFFRRFEETTMFVRLGDYGFVLMAAGILLAMLSAQAFTFNLFGSDRAGLTLQFLSPVTDAQLAWAKIAGVGLVLLVAAGLSLVAALVVAPGGAPSLWIAAFAGTVAVYLMVSPIAVWLSALFPVASDLSKTGSGGNPHGLAGLAGVLSIALASAATAALFAVVAWGLDRPGLVLPVMALWMTASAIVARPLVGFAARTVTLRRENLALVAQGR